MTVPYTFGTATTSIPLSNLDSNFNTPITLGNTAIYLGNTTTTIGNLTLTNVTISSGTANITSNITYATANAVVFTNSSSIGTTNSNLTWNGTNLGITGTLSASGVATFSAGTVSLPAITTTGDTNTGIYFPAADTIAFTEGGVESMRIDSSGNVGIGTTTPATYGKLAVNGAIYSIGGNSMGIGNSDNTNFSYFINSGATGANNANMTFNMTNKGELMRLTSAGNLGIGTTSPATKLHVAAETPILRIDGTGTANSGAILQLLGWTGASKNWQIDTASTSGANELAFTPSTANAGSTFTTLSQSFRTNGTIGLTVSGSTSGAGITFPATQSASSDANTLDDYEEGTWTPTWTPASGSGATVNVASGFYTKVGNMVTVVFRLGTNGHGTSSGNITIGGLPFAASSTSNNQGVLVAGLAANMLIVAGQNLVGQLNPGAATINPVLWNSVNGTQTITATEWGVSGVIWFSGSYFV